jgi:hypothetical protein
MVHFVLTREAHDASAAYIWTKLAEFSDMSWHPLIDTSKNAGNIADGSESIIGDVRILQVSAGKELVETVTAWDEGKRYLAFSIDKGAPPFVKSLTFSFAVREVGGKIFVDLTADLEVKLFFKCLIPLLKFALPKQLAGLIDGVANLKE